MTKTTQSISHSSNGVIVGCVLTLNEEHNIAEALESLRTITHDVIVVDSGSTDRTAELAAALGATVLSREFDSYVAQRNWAIDQIQARHGDTAWCFVLDADERVTTSLADEVHSLVEEGRLHDSVGYLVPLAIQFAGRVLRHGGFQNTRSLRLFPIDAGRYSTSREVNEHLTLPPDASVRVLRSPILHVDVQSWERYIEKHNRYSTLEAQTRVTESRTLVTFREALRRRDVRRRWVRQHVFEHLPNRPLLRFLQSYVLMLGFLDGRAGFRRAVFEAWQEMCVDLKSERLSQQPTAYGA